MPGKYHPVRWDELRGDENLRYTGQSPESYVMSARDSLPPKDEEVATAGPGNHLEYLGAGQNNQHQKAVETLAPKTAAKQEALPPIKIYRAPVYTKDRYIPGKKPEALCNPNYQSLAKVWVTRRDIGADGDEIEASPEELSRCGITAHHRDMNNQQWPEKGDVAQSHSATMWTKEVIQSVIPAHDRNASNPSHQHPSYAASKHLIHRIGDASSPSKRSPHTSKDSTQVRPLKKVRNNVDTKLSNTQHPPVKKAGKAGSGGSSPAEWHLCHETLMSFIHGWRKDITIDIRVSLSKGEVHQESDIDPNSGNLLRAVDYPNTIPDFLDMDPLLQHRRQNWSSNLIASREMARLNGGGDIIVPLPTPNHSQESRKYQNGVWAPEPITGSTTLRKCPPHPHATKIMCHLRPALAGDMPSCAAIYTWEVHHGDQTLDSVEPGHRDFITVLRTCWKIDLPFVVVIEGSPPNTPHPPGGGKILGFGYMSPHRTGMTPASEYGSAMTSVLAQVFVDPEYRRKKIGTGILDKLMSVTSRTYTSKGGFLEFVPDYNPVYLPAHQAPFNAHRIYAEVLIKTEDKESKKPFDQFLEGVFKFQHVATLDSAYRHNKYGAETSWMDMHIYEFQGDDDY